MSADLASVSPSHFFKHRIQTLRRGDMFRGMFVSNSYTVEQKTHYKAAYTNIFKAM